MAYNPELAERVRASLKRRKGATEQSMFGGVCFLINGNMCCGIREDDLVLRLGKPGVLDALTEPHTRPMDLTGKVMTTMVYVSQQGCKEPGQLRDWLDKAVRFSRTLPPKQ